MTTTTFGRDKVPRSPAEAAYPTTPAPQPAAEPAEAPTPSAAQTTLTAREPSGQDELRRARQLAENWLSARAALEELVLSAGERKSFPYLQLRPGTYLLSGRQAWTAYVHHPCTAPEALVRLLEQLLSRN